MLWINIQLLKVQYFGDQATPVVYKSLWVSDEITTATVAVKWCVSSM